MKDVRTVTTAVNESGDQVLVPVRCAIEFKSVFCKIGSKNVLDNVNLAINKGEITGILGPNGAGKTTLLSLMTGLRKHTSGDVTVLDEKLPVRGGRLRQRIGVVLQETALYEELTTFENLRFSASLYNVKDVNGRIKEVLELLMLSERSHQIVRTLSGGLRRRVAIARALLHDPELLIIDEPTLGVDVEARHAIWSHMRVLKSRGRTVIVATNYLDEAQALCDQVAVLRAGKLLTFETPVALLSRTGICLDVTCEDEAGKLITNAVSAVKGVLRVDKMETGLTIFLQGEQMSKEIISLSLQTAQIEGIRMRAPDLLEVFKSLEPVK
jgi:ABC-type multidrug transport system ATPase subunit